MNAQDLSKAFVLLDNQLIDLRKKVDFLENENSNLRLQVKDLKMDLKMLQSDLERKTNQFYFKP